MPDPAVRATLAEHRKLALHINGRAERVRGLVRNYPPRSPIHLYMERLNVALAQARNNQPVDRRALIEQARDGLRSHVECVEDLEASALSAEDRARLHDLIRGLGMSIIETGTLAYRQEANIGTTLVARRGP